MEAIRLRRLAPADIVGLQKLSRQTFTETFADSNTEEDMQQYLNESFSAAKLGAELNNDGSVFYGAESGGEMIGYLKVNFGGAQTELKDSEGMEIERIYVVRDFLGKKVGPMLFAKAVEMAIMKGLKYVWLGVWEENARAISFYKKNGFVEFDRHIFKLGSDEQIDIMMKRIL